MTGPATTMKATRSDAMRLSVLVAGLFTVTTFTTVSAGADNVQVPWECSNYRDEAQTRCLNAFIEQQREQITKLEGQLHLQQESLGQLKNQIDRQAAATADLQQQLSQPPRTTIAPPPYAYSYIYPPVGLGIYLGRPWIYGPPYYGYGRHFWGPRFYGHWGRRW